MTWPIYIDASMIKDFECREFGRQRYLLKRDTISPNIFYEYGTACHKAIQSFWEGKTFEQAMADAYDLTNKYPVGLIKHNVYLSNKWLEMVNQLPDLVAAYYDSVEQDVSKVARLVAKDGSSEAALEYEWQLKYSDDVILCGRIDRVMVGPELPDIKTASEISFQGIPWKQGYQRGKMLEVQFGLYDWYLQQIGMTPRRVYLEVLVKGYKSKPCRYEVIELPYVTTEAYRERFRQQLQWKVSDIVDYFRNKTEQRPWPMTQNMCQTKYGECIFLPICLHGETPKALEAYTERKEHLTVRGGE